MDPTPILRKIFINFFKKSNFEFHLTIVTFASCLEPRIKMGCKYIFIFPIDRWDAPRIMWRLVLLHRGDEVKSFKELRGYCLMEIALILIVVVLSILSFESVQSYKGAHVNFFQRKFCNHTRVTKFIHFKVNCVIVLGKLSQSHHWWIVQSYWRYRV
jgi:hypothetical protein